MGSKDLTHVRRLGRKGPYPLKNTTGWFFTLFSWIMETMLRKLTLHIDLLTSANAMKITPQVGSPLCWPKKIFFNKLKSLWLRRLERWLKVHDALTEDPGLLPCTCTRQLSTAYNTLSWSLWVHGAQVPIHMHYWKQKETYNNKTTRGIKTR